MPRCNGKANVGRKARWAALFACLAAFALPARASRHSGKAAIALFRKSAAASDLRHSSSFGYRLQATVHISMLQGQHLQGTVVGFRAAHGLWRREVYVPGFDAVFGYDGTHEWVKQPMDYVPDSIHLLWTALRFDRRLQRALVAATPRPGKNLRPVPGAWSPASVQLGKPRKEREGDVECVQAKAGLQGRTFCFSASTGDLVREHDSVTGDTFEYFGYFTVGNKAFPRTLRLVNSSGRQLLELQVDSITPLSATASTSLFLPVKGAKQITSATRCTKIVPAKMVKGVPPPAKLVTAFPSIDPPANTLYIQGGVVLDAVIGTDGIPHSARIVYTTSPVFSSATMKAAMKGVSQWRYRPAVCVESGGGRFVRSHVRIPVQATFMLTSH